MSYKIEVAFNQKFFECDNKAWLITLQNGATFLVKQLIIKDCSGIGVFDPNAPIRKAWLEFEGTLSIVNDVATIEKI